MKREIQIQPEKGQREREKGGTMIGVAGVVK